MRANEDALAAELRSRHGVTTTKRLVALGITKRSVEALVRQGRLVRWRNGVLVSASSPDSLQHRMAIACAVTGGVVMFPTAGEVWNLRKTPRVPEVHVVIDVSSASSNCPVCGCIAVGICRTCTLYGAWTAST